MNKDCEPTTSGLPNTEISDKEYGFWDISIVPMLGRNLKSQTEALLIENADGQYTISFLYQICLLSKYWLFKKNFF